MRSVGVVPQRDGRIWFTEAEVTTSVSRSALGTQSGRDAWPRSTNA